MKIELQVAVEMTEEQVQAWAEAIGVGVDVVGADVAEHLRAALREDTASPYWKTEVR